MHEGAPLLRPPFDDEATRGRAVLVTVAAALCVNLAKMAIDTALPVTQAALQKEETHSHLLVSTLPGVGTCAYTVGKIAALLLLNRIGGRIPLLCAAGMVMVVATSFLPGVEAVMFLTWLPWRFSSAWVWPSSLLIMVSWVDVSYHGRVISSIAVAWDAGIACFGFIYMLVLNGPGSWRYPYIISAAIGALSFIILLFFLVETPKQIGFRAPRTVQEDIRLKAVAAAAAAAQQGGEGSKSPVQTAEGSSSSSPATKGPASPAHATGGGEEAGTSAAAPHPLDDVGILGALRIFSGSLRSYMVIAQILAGIPLTYVVMYLPALSMDELGASESAAAMVMLTFNLGSSMGSPLSGWLYDRFPSEAARLGTALAFASSLLVSSCTVPLLYRHGHLNILTLQLLNGVVGFSFGACYYVYQNTYLISVGGPKHMTTLINLVDIIGVGGGALVSMITGRLVYTSPHGFFGWYCGLGVMLASSLAIFAVTHYLNGGLPHVYRKHGDGSADLYSLSL